MAASIGSEIESGRQAIGNDASATVALYFLSDAMLEGRSGKTHVVAVSSTKRTLGGSACGAGRAPGSELVRSFLLGRHRPA